MDLIANDLEKFNQDIEDYHGGYNDLTENHEALVSDMNALNSMWEGEAHNQFMETFAADEQQVSEMIKTLLEVYNDLVFASEKYTDCENSVSGIIAGITV